MADDRIGSERHERERDVAIPTKLPDQIRLSGGGEGLEEQRVYRFRAVGCFVSYANCVLSRGHMPLAFAFLPGENAGTKGLMAGRRVALS